MTASRTYVALGDSMSIDDYTGVKGGGAVNQFYRQLGQGWKLVDHTFDGCQMRGVPRQEQGELITLTIGGNDLLVNQERYLAEGVESFEHEHLALLTALRKSNPQACLIVGNVYGPQSPLPGPWLEGLNAANEAIARNTAAVGAHLADIRTAFQGHEDEFLCLEIEPTLRGATVIADLFLTAARAAGIAP